MTEENFFAPPPENEIPKTLRPGLLTVLCILTFINGGLTLVSSLFVGAFFRQFSELALEFSEKFKLPGLDMISEASPLFFFVNALLYAISVTGAALMWKLRKNGFHVYTISQILMILAPMYFFHLSAPGFFDILLTGIFVILYSLHLKIMK